MKTIIGLVTITLLIASYSLVGFNHIDKAYAASEVIVKEHLKGNFASAQKTITDGSTSTDVTAYAFTTDAGEVQGCIQIFKTDQNTGGALQVFVSCAPAQLTVASGLGSATFSATFNDIEAVSGQEMTVKVDSQLSATGKVQTTTQNNHFRSGNFNQVLKSHGMIRPAAGSLTISGDLTFNIDDATGQISKTQSGQLLIQKS